MSHEDRDDTAVVVRRRGGSFSTMRGALDQRSWVILGGETDETAKRVGGKCRGKIKVRTKCRHRFSDMRTEQDVASPAAAVLERRQRRTGRSREAQAGVFFALVQSKWEVSSK